MNIKKLLQTIILCAILMSGCMSKIEPRDFILANPNLVNDKVVELCFPNYPWLNETTFSLDYQLVVDNSINIQVMPLLLTNDVNTKVLFVTYDRFLLTDGNGIPLMNPEDPAERSQEALQKSSNIIFFWMHLNLTKAGNSYTISNGVCTPTFYSK